MQNVLDALALLLSPQGIAFALAGYLVGCFGGAMIGIGGALTTALVMPFTLSMAPEHAMIVLIGVYSGVSYAGSIPAILINTPGAPSSAASAFDGYPMARKGEATTAIAISATASAFGALIGGLALLAVLPILGKVALLFGSPEFLMFGVFGLASIVAASQAGLVKGFIAGLLGVMLASLGASLLDAHPRFTFGIGELYDGLDLVAMMIGIFAFSEMVRISWNRSAISNQMKLTGSWIRGIVATLREWRALVRGSGIGIVVGLIPGEGGTVATFLSYVSEKQVSREPERFGKGHPAGIAGPEAANNAVIAGALVPTLSFGIPGSVSTAMLLTALGLHGIRPGPDLLIGHITIVYCIVGSVLLGAVLTLGTGIMLSRPLASLTQIPIPFLVPVVSIISVVGVYASSFTYAHIYVALGAGVLGYAVVRLEYPIVAFLLGFIVGPLAELNFMRSYQITGGHLELIFLRPICAVLLVLSVLVIARPLWRSLLIRRRRLTSPQADE
jgi:putative tricarboxylic transport membrane protein